jgi:hypothetical protein
MNLHWPLLVHEKLATIVTFVFSQVPLSQMRKERFRGSWRFLDKFLHEIPEREATKALMELALYFRTLDDEQGLTSLWKQIGEPMVGTLHFRNGESRPLSPRELANKVIHAKTIDWDVSSDPPKIICKARDAERWLRAEVDLVQLG